MRNYKEFERKLTITSLWHSIKKHIIIFLCIFVYFSVFGFVYATQITDRTYKSTGQITNQRSLTGTYLNTIVNTVKNESTLEIIVNNLKEKEITHKNNKYVTNNDLLAGLVFPPTNSSSYLSISFVGKERPLLKPVLQEVLEVTVDVIANSSFADQYKDIRVSSNASEPVDISNTNMKIILFTVLGLGLGTAATFITDVCTDLIYEPRDISSLDTTVFELNYNKSRGGKENE